MQPPARGKAAQLDSFAPSEYSGSTTSTISKIQVKDSQAPVDRPDIGDYVEDDGEESGSGEEEDDDDDDDEEEEGPEDGGEEQQNPALQQQQQFKYEQPAMRQQAQQAPVNHPQLTRSPFDGGDSYPPTTSGGADDEDDNLLSQIEQLQRAALAQRDAPPYPQFNRQVDAPTRRRHQQAPLTHQQFPPTQQQIPPNQQEPPSRHLPKGPQRQTQGQANVPLRPSPPAPKTFTQPNVHLNTAAVLEKARPSSAPQPPQSQLGSNPNSKARPISTGSAMAPAAQVPVPVPHIIQGPQVVEELEASVEEPQIDYGEDVLKAMEYEQLRNEDYDVNPLKPASVLPADEDSKPLPQRLEFAHKLAADHQRTFFASLPLAEWEEAGDWFLEKFSDVVKKMTESRREKRKLAIQLEVEIAHRHEHVDNRKRGIDEALDGMSITGRHVLRAGTPKRQRVAGEGN